MHRVEVRLKSYLPDARGFGLVRDIYDLGITAVSDVRVVDVYWLDANLTTDKLDLVCRSLLADPVTQEYWCGQAPRGGAKSAPTITLLRLPTMLASLTRLRTPS